MDILQNNYPIEYIEGKVHFFGRDFIVTPDVLIPRLETECLVRRARQLLQPKTIVVDIGCGSGIIGTSVADLADEVIFLDISPEALTITEKNFRLHFPEKKAQFIVSDLLGVFLDFSIILSSYPANLLFLSNLPYIRANDWEHMSADTVYEPKLALFGGEKTGFEMYERLFLQISELQLAHFQLLCEFGFDQRETAEIVLNGYPWQYSFFADYARIERFGEITISVE